MQKETLDRGKKKALRKKQRNLKIAGMIVVVCLLVFGIIYGVLYKRVNSVAENAIYHNVMIESVDVSGMTKKAAKQAVEQKIAEYQAKKLTLSIEQQNVDVTFGAIGLTFQDVDRLVEEAVAYGKEGSIWKRYFEIKKLEEKKKIIPVQYRIDAELAKKVFAEQAQPLEKEATNATLKRENGQFVITDEVQGKTIDVDASLKAIDTYLNKEWKQQEGQIQLVSITDEPKVKRSDLETVQDVLGTFTTHCGSGGGRVQNIKTGASRINGAVVMPGEEFSADAAMRPYTAENGYAAAGAYENGKVIQSMGGGICQVSTTLYNALILAELEVTQRQPHSMLVTYVQPAMDAAIAGDVKDLKFKNSTETPIYVEGYVAGGNITFTIYGKETRPANRKIEFVSETLETIPAGKKFVESGSALGTISRQDAGHTGKKSKLWKVVYEDGKEVSRTVFNTSNYMASPATYTVGTASDLPEASALVKSAIASQNEGSIQSAIAEAQAKIAAAAQPVTPPAEPAAPVPPAAPAQ